MADINGATQEAIKRPSYDRTPSEAGIRNTPDQLPFDSETKMIANMITDLSIQEKEVEENRDLAQRETDRLTVKLEAIRLTRHYMQRAHEEIHQIPVPAHSREEKLDCEEVPSNPPYITGMNPRDYR